MRGRNNMPYIAEVLHTETGEISVTVPQLSPKKAFDIMKDYMDDLEDDGIMHGPTIKVYKLPKGVTNTFDKRRQLISTTVVT